MVSVVEVLPTKPEPLYCLSKPPKNTRSRNENTTQKEDGVGFIAIGTHCLWYRSRPKALNMVPSAVDVKHGTAILPALMEKNRKPNTVKCGKGPVERQDALF